MHILKEEILNLSLEKRQLLKQIYLDRENSHKEKYCEKDINYLLEQEMIKENALYPLTLTEKGFHFISEYKNIKEEFLTDELNQIIAETFQK